MAGNQALDLGILDFGVSLFEAIAENDTRNVCISPIAVQTVLTAMYTGAEEQTATELLKGLHFTGVPSTDKIAKQMSQLVAPILISPVIQMSTGIYLNAEYQMQFVWGVEINQQFLTDVEQLNFTENQAAANTMNAYVSNITFDRIENLVQPKWINSNTSSVLVVAIYVNGAWQYPFDRRMEPNVPFFNDMKSCDKAMKTVNMLHVKVSPFVMPFLSKTISNTKLLPRIQATFNYKSHKPLEATIIEVPYNDPSFSIVIFVPHKCGTLRSLSTKLHTTFNFKDLHNILEQRVVDLYMPEFTIDYEVANMKRALETVIFLNHSKFHNNWTKANYFQIGFHDIFSPATANFEGALEILTSSSNFAGITGPNLYIDRIVHKAVINVTQPGSMAYYKSIFMPI